MELQELQASEAASDERDESTISELSSQIQNSQTTFKILPWNKVSDSILGDWIRIRNLSSHYRSPFWSPDFVGHVERVRSGIELAVAQRNGQAIAILPFRRRGSMDVGPVGAGINDAHGLLADPGIDFSFDEFLKRAGLRSFSFHAAPPHTPGISQFEVGRTRSFLADLTVDPQGYEHYLRQRNRTIDKQGQKSRKLGREVGELRFDFHCESVDLLERLRQLKSQQYQRTHTFDIFSVDWIRDLLVRLHSLPEHSELRGVLSVLHAGSTPVALHFGIEEGDLLHYWFPVFDPDYHFGSPGTQLFLDVAKTAAERGIRSIDMGYGEQAYKHKLTNVVTEMSYGLVDSSRIRRSMYRARLALSERLKRLAFREQLKPLARRLMPGFGSSSYAQ